MNWSWVVGGWAGIHAALVAAAVLMGAQLNVNTVPLRIVATITVAAWATAAIAAWRFRRVFQLKAGLTAACASFIAGVTLPLVGDASAGALVDGATHVLVGVGFALMLWSARQRLTG